MDVNMKTLWMMLCLFSTTLTWAKFSVTTYNIRNFDHDRVAGPTNIAELKKVLGEVRSEVMAFQEIVNAKAFDALMKQSLPGHQIVKSSCGGGGKQALALAYETASFELVKTAEDLTFSSDAEACGSLRPLFLVTLKEKKTKKLFIFAVAHLKAGGDARAMQTRWEQYRKLQSVIARESGELIILGDLNTTGYNIRNQDYTKFEDFLSRSSYRTSAELVNCTSYWDGADGVPGYKSSVLDHILMGDDLFKTVEGVSVGAHCKVTACQDDILDRDLGKTFASVSDHCPVRVTFK